MEEELLNTESITERHFEERGVKDQGLSDDDDVWDEHASELEYRTHITEERTLKQAGYRDGQAEVSEISRQKGFDDGYKQGMITGKLIGSFIGELIVYQHELQSEQVVNWERKKIIDELIKSLMYQGSQEKYSSSFLDQLLPTVQLLPSQYQEQYQTIRDSAQSQY